MVTRRCLIASMRSFLIATSSKQPSIPPLMPKVPSIEATILLSNSELIRQRERTELFHHQRQQRQQLLIPLPLLLPLAVMDNKFKMIPLSHQRPTQHHNLINQISSRVNSKRRKVLVMTVLAVLEVMVLMEIMELMDVNPLETLLYPVSSGD